ncbi:hypothetical protein F511_30444 [Dorcoceras hygrometricum]|uniref:Uncharacterized protein n=1 Tax=Dorcoceras hygrometricum TaxID=472368 RepID=A0A2Z7D7N2_9LAMI|nr:hypothetical protein F511_30444 [Dorcoceras hygrometricum]
MELRVRAVQISSEQNRFRSISSSSDESSLESAHCIPEPLRVTQVLDSKLPHGYSAQCVEHEKRVTQVLNPIVLISSGFLVQSDEGISDLVVDRIGVSTAIYREAPGS